MDKMSGGMFNFKKSSNICPPLNFPDDSQCPKCRLFDTSRLDVLKILADAFEDYGKRAPDIRKATCRCGLRFTQGRIEDGRQGMEA